MAIFKAIVSPDPKLISPRFDRSHGPEVLEGKKSSLMGIGSQQRRLDSVNQQLTFGIVGDR